MARAPGRPADEQHRRMARMLHALVTHPRTGRTIGQLMLAADLDPTDPSHVRKTRRDIKALRTAGWHIDTPKRGHNEFTYRLHVIDNRIRTTFTAEQRAQLLRAAERANLAQLYDDLDPDRGDGSDSYEGPESLGTAEHAVRHRCVLTFTYRERKRRVHPYDVFFAGDEWFFRGREEGTDLEFKTFRLSRAEGLCAELPGTADAARDLPTPNRDPMRVAATDPIPVVVATHEIDLPDVVAHLGTNGHRRLDDRTPDGELLVEVIVTNPPALLGRLFELDTRVRLVGPEPVRAQARDLLLSAAGRAR